MRYKSFKRRRSKVLKMKFQSFVDISTEADTMKIISISAGGSQVIQRLAPFFAAYKYYKLGNVSFKMLPASTLPVDPLQLSYDASDLDAVDPRDQLTPGMCRITNGEDILEDITGLTGDQQRELYNNMLLDPRWYKWMLQSGVKRFGKPRYWQIGQLHQDKWPGAFLNIPELDSDDVIKGTTTVGQAVDESSFYTRLLAGSSPRGLFQTGHRGVLGWMPTDNLQPTVIKGEGDAVIQSPLLAAVPEVELFKILMPPVRKTNYYYRCFITETVYFKDPVVMNVNGYRPIDVFHLTPYGPKSLPTSSNGNFGVPDRVTGGNDGSD